MSKPYSSTQQIVLAIIPCITGTLSICGSGTILYMILSDWKRLKNSSQTTYNRLLLAMSSLDILVSARYAFMLSNLTVPKDTPGVWGAQGTTATCTAAGFFSHFGLAVPFYNGALSLFYVLKVRYELDDNIISTKVEPFIHIICLLFPLVTGIVGIVLDSYNALEHGSGCWWSPYPLGCDQDPAVECTRGDNADIFAMLFGGIPIGILFVFISACMASIYFKVRSQERRMLIYSFRGRNASVTSSSFSEADKTRQTATQALLYIGAFFLTYTFGCIERLLQDYSNAGGHLFVISLLSLIFLPMQGLFNFLIFIRLRYQKARRQNQDKSWLWVLRQVVCTKETMTGRGRSRRRSSLPKAYPPSVGTDVSTNLPVAVESVALQKAVGPDTPVDVEEHAVA